MTRVLRIWIARSKEYSCYTYPFTDHELLEQAEIISNKPCKSLDKAIKVLSKNWLVTSYYCNVDDNELEEWKQWQTLEK